MQQAVYPASPRRRSPNPIFSNSTTGSITVKTSGSTAAGPPIAGRHGPLLGDIVLARETVAGEAADRDIDLGHHATHLIVHGFLHLVGYDHETENEAVVMEGLETFIMKDLGIADPYAS